MNPKNTARKMKKYVDFSVKGILFALVFVMTSCLSDGDETVSLEFANVKKMIVGEWCVEGVYTENNNGSLSPVNSNLVGSLLTFDEDGFYTDSSTGGIYRWLLDSNVNDNKPYYGDIRLNNKYYEIVSLGENLWWLRDSNGRIIVLKRQDDSSLNVEVDNRINNVVPIEIQNKIDDYIPIYRGVNPPNITGVYLIEPMTAVYCEDNGFAPGETVKSEIIRFSNQNSKTNTIDFEEYNVENANNYQEGKGAFISGSGSNFTAYFNTEGSWSGIYNKTALVISGTKTSNGIKDLYYAFIMVKKGSDPKNTLMKEGVYRVFKDGDGISTTTSWNKNNSSQRRIKATEAPWGIFTYKSNVLGK